jgi:hypothetical protein
VNAAAGYHAITDEWRSPWWCSRASRCRRRS